MLKNLFLCIPVLAGILLPQAVDSQGLRFCGEEQLIDQRTSYNVFGGRAITYSPTFDVEFDVSLYPEKPIGYILRIKCGGDDTVFNLFYDGQSSDSLRFNLNREGHSRLVGISMGKDKLPDMQWNRMKLSFDTVRDSVHLSIGNYSVGQAGAGLPKRFAPEVVFGKSDYYIDVPSFAIRDLSVGNQSKNYRFPLGEHTGNTVHDERGRTIGTVSNPEWLINDSYQWKLLGSFSSETVAGAIYNPDRKEVYYLNRDQITVFDVLTGSTTVRSFETPCPLTMQIGTCFLDIPGDRLYVYDVYYERRLGYEGPTVASLDLETYEWSSEGFGHLRTQLHHHGSWFDQEAKRYNIFGGFGHMRYSRDFHSLDLDTGEWTTLNNLEDTGIWPRYFSSVGYDPERKYVYVFGGMGNESGEHAVGRQYLYDLYRISIEDGDCEKLWEIPWTEHNVVPVRGMVIFGDECFYTICYPEHLSDSALSLYRFSIEDGDYQILGTPIPIRSDKIKTNANLYHEPVLGRMYALVQEFEEDDIASKLTIYSLTTPPVTADELDAFMYVGRDRVTIIAIAAAVMLLALGGWITVRRIRKKRAMGWDDGTRFVADGDAQAALDRMPYRQNAVYLFGDFAARDRHGRDISYMFSTRLKQTFCLVLQYSAGEGITSSMLSGKLWPDKPEDRVKNTRGVTINHLRKVLGEMDGVELVFDKGFFKIVQDERFYCDSVRCADIVMTGQVESCRDELIGIVARGKFLQCSNDPIYDSFKKDIERLLEPSLTLEMEKSLDLEAYREVIDIADALFNIDPLNDEALLFTVRAMQRLKMNDEARILYKTFVTEYKNNTGEEYKIPFKNI